MKFYLRYENKIYLSLISHVTTTAVRTWLILIAASMLGACASDIIAIKSTPAGATVTVDGYGECETPCRIQLLSPVMATVAKAAH